VCIIQNICNVQKSLAPYGRIAGFDPLRAKAATCHIGAYATASNSQLDAQRHRGQTGRMTPEDYEKAVLQRFRTLCPPPRFVVKHNIRLSGHKTKTPRQVDIGVFETGKSQPFLHANTT
jgi:hypothetical protein